MSNVRPTQQGLWMGHTTVFPLPLERVIDNRDACAGVLGYLLLANLCVVFGGHVQ